MSATPHKSINCAHNKFLLPFFNVHGQNYFCYFFFQVGRTALFKTVERCDEFAVKLLLNKGALVNIADKDGMTALHVSIPTYSPTLVYLLVSKGAIIDATDNVSHNYAPHVQVSVNRSTSISTPSWLIRARSYSSVIELDVIKSIQILFSNLFSFISIFLSEKYSFYL